MTPFAFCLLAAIGWGTVPPSPPPEAFNRKVKDLAQHLTSDDAKRRARAEEELLALGPEATEPLLLMVKDAEPAQLEAILSILPKYGPAAVERLYRTPRRYSATSSKAERQAEEEAVMAVARMGEAALPEIKRFIDTGDGPSPEGSATSVSPWQSFGIRVLRQMGPPALPGLIELLNHSDHDVRTSVATLLGNLADPRTADALLAALDSKDVNVRMGAAQGLGKLQDRRATERLLRVLTDPGRETRRAAAVALGRMWEPGFLRPLVRVARNDPVAAVRDTAANVLINWSHDRVAIRLGRRYKPINIDPVAEETIRLADVIRLLLTGLAIYLLLWAGVKHQKPGGVLGVPKSVWASAGAIAFGGFLWGRVLVGLSGQVEWLLLVAIVPATAWVSWMAGLTLKPLRVPVWGLGLTLLLVVVAPLFGILWWLFLMWLAPRMLWLFLAVAVIAAWWLGRRTDRALLASIRRATVVGTAAFYAGYGLGWLALWGYFGF